MPSLVINPNPNSLAIFEKYIDKKYNTQFSTNPNYISELEHILDNTENLESHHITISLLEDDIFNITYDYLLKHPNAIHILKKYFSLLENYLEIDVNMLSSNEHAIHILEKKLDRIDWTQLSKNKNAIHILEKNLDKVNWLNLSQNPNAIHILEKNLDKVNWTNLSQNPNALHILSKHSDKIKWINLSSNPGLFELDYLAMSKNRIKIIEQELISKALHPSRISKWLDYHLENGKDISDFEY